MKDFLRECWKSPFASLRDPETEKGEEIFISCMFNLLQQLNWVIDFRVATGVAFFNTFYSVPADAHAHGPGSRDDAA